MRCLLARVTLSLTPFLAPLGCTRQQAGAPSPTVAIVNDRAVTQEELVRALREAGGEFLDQTGTEDLRQLKQSLLDQLIERKLLLAEAERLGIKPTEEELQETITSLRGETPEEEFQKMAKEGGTGFEEWKKTVGEDLIIGHLVRMAVDDRVEVSEKEIHTFYEGNTEAFSRGEEVRASQIVVKTREEATALKERLMEGADFAQLAKEKSHGPEAINGGDLGYFEEMEMPPEFEGVFSLQVGEISPVIETTLGYHLIKVADKRPQGIRPLSDVIEKIRTHLFHQKREALLAKWLEDMKNKSEIKINFALLDMIQ